MTDQQVLTICITLCVSLVVPVSSLIYSNRSVTEAKETLRAEMAAGFLRMENKIDHLADEVARLQERSR